MLIQVVTVVMVVKVVMVVMVVTADFRELSRQVVLKPQSDNYASMVAIHPDKCLGTYRISKNSS